MEFVGKKLRKEFEGFGTFEGVVESYDSSTGFFKILYEDGDSEEADYAEVSRLAGNLISGTEEKVVAKRVGRKPKKRRRFGRDPVPGKGSEIPVVDSDLDVKNLEKLENLDGTETELGENEVNVCGNGNLDLNVGFDLKENVEIKGIDLNLTVENGELDGGVDKGKKEREFDLNLGLNDESLNDADLQTCGGDIACGIMENSGLDASGATSNHVDCGRVLDAQLEEDGNENSGRRKRRKVARSLNSPGETVLRRSARQAKAAALSEGKESRALVVDEANDLSMSGVTDESEEKPNLGRLEEETGLVIPSPVVELPPSSTKLNLDGIPVLDLFSVYSCLRSFSTLLYLSPFKLEDFVAALKNRVSNLLIDSIHVAILQLLRKHLEFLANEGCESASSCLRNMNWDLLDVVTWPVFMVEYLLVHGSGIKPGFSLESLMLFDGEYYKQQPEVKLELLRCLCDDVMEVEAIRSELVKRMNMADAAVEIERMTVSGSTRKRRTSSDTPGDSCLNDDVTEEVADGNSDECCLCKMDGNLICCDGCPAAYHSKCVGIVSCRLPDGDWYCPECLIGRLNFGTKPQKSMRGAEFLGNDPYGRLYFSCFDYLLVSDSYDAEASFNYYHKDELSAVIQLLLSSDIHYGSILRAISKRWAIAVLPEVKGEWESDCCTLKDGKLDGRKRRSSVIPENSNPLLRVDTVKHNSEAENPRTSSEGSAEVLQADQLITNSPGSGPEIGCQAALTKSISASKQRKKNSSSAGRRKSSLKTKEEDVLQEQAEDSYRNCYSFARTASSVVDELLRKPSDKVNIDIPKTEEEIISIQLKFILKKSSKFCWITAKDSNVERQKEKCGWCYCCRFPVEGRNCLFNFMNQVPVAEGLKAVVDAVMSKKNKKGHLVDVICYILCMEERLRGLLLGPWLSPQYSELWRKSVLKASDVSSLKRPLLMLESNLSPLALSADWWKHVDSATTVGSASHFVASSRFGSKNGVNRRKGRFADPDIKSLSAGSGLGLFWWRGGKISRNLFNWKVVPHSLALKAARKAGGIKIPGIQYPDGSENARRGRCVAWRASVEASTSVEQLALQVRELDFVVRWDDIENTRPHSILDKESVKAIRLFKKAIIRRKCVQESHVKYLIDFGKRRSIPDVVIKHGQKLEDSSDERKRYWLDESYVPLHLLKSFEERRITRKAGKKKSSKVVKGGRVIKKQPRDQGFDYLFSRAERADSYQCRHCNKNVPISEAVSCQLCEGFFHKRHVMKSSEGFTSRCTYTCHRCRAGKHTKTESMAVKRKSGRLQAAKNLKVESRARAAVLRAKSSKNGKAMAKCRRVNTGKDRKVQQHEEHLPQENASLSVGVNLRRSARRAKYTPPQPKSVTGARKRKRSKSRNVGSKKSSKGSSWQKRRTQVLHPFWLNGLHLSRKPNDERVVQFKRRKLLVLSEFLDGNGDKPKCSLCSENGFMEASMYIGCEICGDWFHGNAFGLSPGNTKSLIGFKCHVCREKSPPVCPFVDISGDTKALCTEAASKDGTHDAQGLPEVLKVLQETYSVDELYSDEIPTGLVEVQAVQNSDGNLEHEKTPFLVSELRLENGSPGSKEFEVNVTESQNGYLIADVTSASCENILEGDKSNPVESELTTLDEAGRQSCTSVLDGMDAHNPGIAEESSAGKEVEAGVLKSQNWDLSADVPTVSCENILQGSRINLIESQLVTLDETVCQSCKSVSDGMDANNSGIAEGSPVGKEVKVNAIVSQNGVLKADVPAASREIILEGNTSDPVESLVTAIDGTGCQSFKSVADVMDAKNSETAEG